ncbi:MAG: NAD-dependent epimerase/dehydratase family protein [Candidatus Tritonobacter lacicola]|nr:NAD-dependent epimerase/dehydratase family protein [Candidatus Tritonobacter lacicola]
MISLVTGAAGFIGRHLVERLVFEGKRVRALARPSWDISFLRSLGVEVAVGDLLDGKSLRKAVDGVSHVYHAGALVSDWGKKRDFIDSIVGGTRNLAEECLRVNVDRFVCITSAAVYGYPKAELIDENMPYRKRSIPYIDAKIEAEKLIFSYYRKKGLPVVAVRPTMVYGPRCKTYVLEVVRHIRSGSMVLLDGGRHAAGLCYVGNLVDALILAGEVPDAVGQAFNVSDGSRVTWWQYINGLASVIGKGTVTRSIPSGPAYLLACLMEITYRAAMRRSRPLLTRLAVLEFGREQNYDISKAKSVLAYEPAVQFDGGLSRVAEWLKEEGWV